MHPERPFESSGRRSSGSLTSRSALRLDHGFTSVLSYVPVHFGARFARKRLDPFRKSWLV